METIERLNGLLEAERAGAFAWRYLEEGPEVWRVEIRKT